MSEGRIAGTDLKNGIVMLQTALWREYRETRLEHHDDLSYTTHVACKRCGAAWSGDVLSHPERHERWCPLSWQPDLEAAAEQPDGGQGREG